MARAREIGPLLPVIPLQVLGVKAETTSGKADSTALSSSAIARTLFFPRFASSQTQ
jgi:hypothetical protein